jgi:hemolysin activation/secretion protein
VKGRIAALAAGICLAAAAQLTLAQAVPPAAPTPGAVQSSLPAKPAQPKPGTAPAVQTPAAPAPGVSPGGPAVLVRGFQITGNTVFSAAELQAELTPWFGKRQTLAQLYEAADKLTEFYHRHGYGLAYVSLPAQTLSNGTVRLQVVEGRIGNIAIQGNDRTSNDTLIKRVGNIHTGDVYSDAAMERAALLLNDLPGVQARAVLSPGQQFGTSDVLFKVQETPYSGDVSVDNYGRSVIGRWRLNADVSVNSLTGHGDQLTAAVTHSAGNLLNFGKLGYSVPVGPAGGTLTAGWNRAVYRVGGSLFGPLDISGSTQNGSLNYLYAQERTQHESFYWGLGATHNTSDTNTSGTRVVTTNINLLQFTTFYTRSHADFSYYTLAGNLWTNGKRNDGTKNSAERLRLQFDASDVKPFANLWRFIVSGSLAYSPDPLVDTDKFSLGGPDNIRGFLPAEQRGDRGVFGSMELQRMFAVGGLPMALGGFVDTGKVWNLAYLTVPANSRGLTSVGAEWLAGPASGSWNLRLQLAWAVGGYRPSDDTPDRAVHNADRGPHVWFTFGTRF